MCFKFIAVTWCSCQFAFCCYRKAEKNYGMHLKQYICIRTEIDRYLNDGIMSSNECDALRIRYVAATVDLMLITDN